jgi:hypothetical protein
MAAASDAMRSVIRDPTLIRLYPTCIHFQPEDPSILMNFRGDEVRACPGLVRTVNMLTQGKSRGIHQTSFRYISHVYIGLKHASYNRINILWFGSDIQSRGHNRIRFTLFIDLVSRSTNHTGNRPWRLGPRACAPTASIV